MTNDVYENIINDEDEQDNVENDHIDNDLDEKWWELYCDSSTELLSHLLEEHFEK